MYFDFLSGVIFMKKIFTIFAALILSATFAFAVEPTANSVGPWNPDNNVPNGYTETNDYSFDYATGEYLIFVICEIDIANVTGNIYLGWLNPDGAKDLGSDFSMVFRVSGGNGWPFEATASFGENAISNDVTAYSMNEQTNQPDNNVFITGSSWSYSQDNSNWSQVGSSQRFFSQHFSLSGGMGMFKFGNIYTGPELGSTYGPEGTHNTYPFGQDVMKRAWNGTQTTVGVPREYDNACQGSGYFKLVPGTVWAAPDAAEGFYTFPVYVEVDYLTFKNAPNFYYTGTPVPADPSSFTLQTN